MWLFLDEKATQMACHWVQLFWFCCRPVSGLARGPVIGQTAFGMEEAVGSIPARSANPIHQFPVMNGRNRPSVDLAGFLRGQRPQLRKTWIVD